MFYVYLPISKVYALVLYFSSFLPFGVCFDIALNWCWYNFPFGYIENSFLSMSSDFFFN